MSISSASSDYGDGCALADGDDAEVDFYALLNVPRDASPDDINKAYRQKCKIFHPDRHVSLEDKKEAEKVFIGIRKAYETLSNPNLRAIYDTVGSRGLELQGWELVSKSHTAENIRQEYEFLKRLRDTEIMLQKVHPTSSFACKTSLVGVFAKNPDERCSPQFIGTAQSQSVECTLNENNKIGLLGRVKMNNGKGDGSVTVHWGRSIPSLSVFETAFTMSPNSYTLTGKIAKNIFSRAAVICQPSLQYFPLQSVLAPSCSIAYTMRLTSYWQGTMALQFGSQSAFVTSVIKAEDNQPKFLFALTLSGENSNIRTSYTWRKPENESVLETSCVLGLFGASPAISFERRLSRYSRIGCSLSLTLPMCLLNAKFKIKTGSSVFEWQLAICDNKDDLARGVLFGVIIPVIAFRLARLIFRDTYERLLSLFDDRTEERLASVDSVKREDAKNIVNLMRPTAERIMREEESHDGLIIEEAKYGEMIGEGRSSLLYPLHGDKVIDVTIPLQAMVNNSQLWIYSVKSQLSGFYDPCPMEPKMLRVVYKYRGHMHSVSVPDEMALHIPMSCKRIFLLNLELFLAS